MKYNILYAFEKDFEAKDREEAKVLAKNYLYELAESNSGSELLANEVEIVEIEEY